MITKPPSAPPRGETDNVYILVWNRTGDIYGDIHPVCYRSFETACLLAEGANRRRTWRHKIFGSRWTVQSLKVVD
jgi:hypothetical protein